MLPAPCRYLYFLEPVVEPQLLEEAKRDVEAFRRAEGGNGSAGTLKATSDPLLTGPALQRHLETWAKAHNHTSYIADMWYDLYLLDRSPLLLNLNPQLTWKDDVVPSKQAQPARAANLVHAAARYYLTLRSQRLLPDVYHTKGITKEGTAADVLLWTIGTVVPRRVACYPMYGLGGCPHCGDDEEQPDDDTDATGAARLAFTQLLLLASTSEPPHPQAPTRWICPSTPACSRPLAYRGQARTCCTRPLVLGAAWTTGDGR